MEIANGSPIREQRHHVDLLPPDNSHRQRPRASQSAGCPRASVLLVSEHIGPAKTSRACTTCILYTQTRTSAVTLDRALAVPLCPLRDYFCAFYRSNVGRPIAAANRSTCAARLTWDHHLGRHLLTFGVASPEPVHPEVPVLVCEPSARFVDLVVSATPLNHCQHSRQVQRKVSSSVQSESPERQ